MLSIKVLGIDSALSKIDKNIETEVERVAVIVEEAVKKFTPIKSGRARRGWSKKETFQGFNVNNKVPYIGRLEEGYSKQAPKGIIGPTLREIKRKI